MFLRKTTTTTTKSNTKQAPASLKADDTDDVAVPRRYDLKGYERSFSISPTGCTRLAHVLSLQQEGNSNNDGSFLNDAFHRHAVSAFCHVMWKHPKMRALVTKQDHLVCEIVPAAEVTDEQVQKLVTVQFINNENNSNEEEIQALVQEACNKTVDRTTQFPFSLIVLLQKQNTTSSVNDAITTLILLSDHAFSDVTSGIVVLNDFLTTLRLLMLLDQAQTTTADDDEQKKDILRSNIQEIKSQLGNMKQHELPLRPPLYDSLRPPPTLWQRGADAMITSFGENFLIPSIANFLPVLAPRPDMHHVHGLPLPHNPSYCYMATGSTEHYQAAVSKCRQEQVSLTGAITACLVMAYAKAAGAPYAFSTTNAPNPKFLVSIDLQYDMRRRIKNPYPESTVGCNVFCAAQEVFGDSGIDLQANSFWKVARLAQTTAESTVSSWNAMAEYIYTHHKFHANVSELKLHANHGIISDVSLCVVEAEEKEEEQKPKATLDASSSSILTHSYDLNEIAAGTKWTVHGLHVYHSMPNVSYGAVVFVTTVNQTFHYTLMSKLSDQDSKTLLQRIVKAVEGIGNLTKSSDEPILQTITRAYDDDNGNE